MEFNFHNHKVKLNTINSQDLQTFGQLILNAIMSIFLITCIAELISFLMPNALLVRMVNDFRPEAITGSYHVNLKYVRLKGAAIDYDLDLDFGRGDQIDVNSGLM